MDVQYRLCDVKQRDAAFSEHNVNSECEYIVCYVDFWSHSWKGNLVFWELLSTISTGNNNTHMNMLHNALLHAQCWIGCYTSVPRPPPVISNINGDMSPDSRQEYVFKLQVCIILTDKTVEICLLADPKEASRVSDWSKCGFLLWKFLSFDIEPSGRRKYSLLRLKSISKAQRTARYCTLTNYSYIKSNQNGYSLIVWLFKLSF